MIKAIALVTIVSIPWVFSFIGPGYVKAINEPIRQSYMLTGGSLFSCTIDSYNYFLRSILIAAPIAITCVLALAILAYFLSSARNQDVIDAAKTRRKENYHARRLGLEALKKEFGLK